MARYKADKSPDWYWFPIIVIILIILFLLYLSTLGRADYVFNSAEDEDDGLKERKRIAEHRHHKLIEHITKHEKQKIRLARWFRWVYFSVRVLLVGLWAGFNLVLYNKYEITELGDILNWNEVILLSIFVLIFLLYRNLTNLNEMLKFVRNRVENWVYGKFVDGEKLNEKIERLRNEKEEIEKEISEIEKKQKK